MTDQTEERFSFSIGWSAWIGGGLFAGLLFVLGGLSGASGANLWMFALVPVGILAGSVLIHEISHAVLMETSGVRVGKIVLEVWGGYTSPADTNLPLWHLPPVKYFLIAVSGPAVNLLVAAGLWLVVFGGDSPQEPDYMIDEMERFWLWIAFQINLLMGIFNLVPVHPLDGGHALRSILSAITGIPSVAGVLSGTFSLSLGVAGLRIMFAEYQKMGWEGVLDKGFLFFFVVVVVVFSSIILLEAASNINRELGEVTINFVQKVAVVILTIAVMVTVYTLHFEGYWASLPQI